jgi:hypothetical protein
VIRLTSHGRLVKFDTNRLKAETIDGDVDTSFDLNDITNRDEVSVEFFKCSLTMSNNSNLFGILLDLEVIKELGFLSGILPCSEKGNNGDSCEHSKRFNPS